jgi:hypothetical protein
MAYHLSHFWLPGLVSMSGLSRLPKETSPVTPVGLHHLQEIWEDTVSPMIIEYLESKEVKWTSLDPVHMRYVGDSSHPVII